jgi:hypothetical protein
LNKKVTFILGAGFSKAIFPQMPLLKDLSIELGNRMQKEDINIVNLWNDYALNSDTSDFELLLSAIFQSAPWKDDAQIYTDKALYERIAIHLVDILNEREDMYFRNISSENYLFEFIDFLEKHNSTVITFNYDTILETMFCKKHEGEMTQGTFGATLVSLFKSIPLKSILSRLNDVWLGGEENYNFFELLKLHGSINWYHNDDTSGATEIFYVDKYQQVVKGRNYDEKTRHEEEISKAGLKPLIIPPVLEKSNQFINKLLKVLWIKAREELAKSDDVIIIGYSFPKSDVTVDLLFRFALRRQATIYIVDVNPKVAERLRIDYKSFRVNDEFVSNHNPFKNFVIGYVRKNL